MSAKLINGREIAAIINSQTKAKIAAIVQQSQTPPTLAVILIGDDVASAVYVENKNNTAKALGIITTNYLLPETTSQEELIELIDSLNANANIHGVLLQLPIPQHISKQAMIEHIDPRKDVDGFHPLNIGLLAQRNPRLRPCTPAGVMAMLQHEGVMVKGKDVTIVGSSMIVGMPLALEMLNAGATPTICNRNTRDLPERVASADVLVVATGNPGLIPGAWVKPGVVAIDVGINRLANGKLTGDLQFKSVAQKASLITPVPGGVGPMTVAMLMENTVQAFLLQQAGLPSPQPFAPSPTPCGRGE